MAQEFRFQDPGEGIHEAEVLEVRVSKGDDVREGQEVLVVETDKASFDVSAPFGGTVQEVRVGEGDMIRVGDVLMTIAGEGEEAGADDRGEEEAEEEGERAEDRGREREEDEDVEDAKQARAGEKRRRKESGKRTKRQKEKREKRARRAGKAEERREREAREADEEPERRRGGEPVPAAPATRRVARELGVDLRDVPGSGEGGRVLTDDVRAFAERGGEGEAREPGTRGPEPAERPAAELPDFSRFGEVERRPLRSVRRATARRMARSWDEIPHVTHNDLADITELEGFRRRHAAEIEERGGRLTLTVLVMKAVAAAIADHPRFNASLDPRSEEIVFKHYIHLGIALDSERGLLVPVIRDVDRKSLTDLAVELGTLAERVRAGEVSRDDMTGGSFTITNVGSLGGTHFTPIINHPEVAILGVGRARLQPVVRGSLEQHELVPRLLLPLSFGFDHRVNDGADAARFVNRVIEVLGDPETLALAA